MSFLLQCVFYLIKELMVFLNDEYVIPEITDGFRYGLVCVSFVLAVIGLAVVLKKKVSVVRYLDIPLIFVGFGLDVLFDMFVSSSSPLIMIPSLFNFVPSTICLIRQIRWIVDVAKKRRKPQKKNVPVLIGYVLASAVLLIFSFTGMSFFEPKSTQDDINLVNSCYEYTEKYLYDLPDDAEELKRIATLTAKVTEKDVFKSTFDESLYFENSDGGSLRHIAALKDANRKIAYSEIVALRLKTLIATKDYEGYKLFFTENAGYLCYNQISYADFWEKDKEYITDETFEVIIASYEDILSLCDNDNDRSLVLTGIMGFYDVFKPNSEDIEIYQNQIIDIIAKDSFPEELLNDDVSYTSKKLRVD